MHLLILIEERTISQEKDEDAVAYAKGDGSDSRKLGNTAWRVA